MLGQSSLPNEKSSWNLQLQTHQAALCQDVTPHRRTRLLWTGFGFAVLVLIAVSLCATFPLASLVSAKASQHDPMLGFSRLPSFDHRGILPAWHRSDHPTALRITLVSPHSPRIPRVQELQRWLKGSLLSRQAEQLKGESVTPKADLVSATIDAMPKRVTLTPEQLRLQQESGHLSWVEDRLRATVPVEHLEIVDVTNGHTVEGFSDGSKKALHPHGLELQIMIVSDAFHDRKPVQRAQVVMGALGPEIESGAIHALPRMKALTPAEWQKRMPSRQNPP